MRKTQPKNFGLLNKILSEMVLHKILSRIMARKFAKNHAFTMDITQIISRDSVPLNGRL
jgi:hypothetical protein